MHHRTVATLEEFGKVHWFSRVGVRDTATAIVLASWQGAIAHCSSIDWENLRLEMANQYRERLIEQSEEQREGGACPFGPGFQARPAAPRSRGSGAGALTVR